MVSYLLPYSRYGSTTESTYHLGEIIKMHAWPIFWAPKTPKNVPITGESTICDISKEFESGNPRQEKTMCFFF